MYLTQVQNQFLDFLFSFRTEGKISFLIGCPSLIRRPEHCAGGARLVPLVVQEGKWKKISKDLLRGRLMTRSVSPCENK